MAENETESPDIEAAKTEPNAEPDAKITALPTFTYYHKMYGVSCSGNDRKAVGIFREYENQEKVKRLKSEMLSVSQKRVAEEVCDRFIGKNRKAKFNGYDAWARMMLSVLSIKR